MEIGETTKATIAAQANQLDILTIVLAGWTRYMDNGLFDTMPPVESHIQPPNGNRLAHASQDGLLRQQRGNGASVPSGGSQRICLW